jgi:glyoxylase-like metal-dependent hydrolase (beta-lactamase superfamily II)
MNELEAQLDYPQADAIPPLGQSIVVAPGIKWIRMTLPFALDHVNIWLLRDRVDGREGWSVIDCGVANDTTRNAWEQVFADELDGLPVVRVIVTHMHPDHIGLADWLVKRWTVDGHVCRMWISATDFQVAQQTNGASSDSLSGPRAAEFMASHGLVEPDSLQKVRDRVSYYSSLVPSVPRQYRRLVDGMTVTIGGERWTCMVGYGHAPEHMAFFNERLNVLIAGDMVLPRISTNVSVFENEPEGDPLTQYLDSLDRMLPLPADCLVLPSHGRPFVGLHTRIRQLHDHHETHFAEVLGACREAPQCANDLLMLLFKRKLDLHQTTFAMGESIAHLNAMWHAGTLARTKDAQGVWRFSPA